MTKFSLKALSATLLGFALVFFGLQSPANAATISPTATATGAIGTTGTNAFPMTFTLTTQESTATQMQVLLAVGWTFVQEPLFASCSWVTVTGVTPNMCGGVNGGGIILYFPSAIPSNTTINIAVPANTFNVAADRTFFVITSVSNNGPPETVDSGNATLAGGITASTVTFDGNGATGGSTSSQSSAVPAGLTTNGFSKTGYRFTGWNAAANGSGTSWTPGGNYGFVADITLYAQWEPDGSGAGPSNNLANTGVDSPSATLLLAGGLSLALVGAEMFMIARRKRSN